MFHQNIRGLESSLDSLEVTLEELTPCVVILTEHKMIESSMGRLNLKGYNISAFYGRTKSRGGGGYYFITR